MRKSLLLLPLFLLACTGPAPQSSGVDLDGLPTFTLRATGDIALPEPMTMAAFVPNSVAEWAGHILLLSETGDVWRTTSEGEPPEKIASGPFTDIYGLSRPNKAGVFLALGAGGKLSAFIERDDQGNYKPLGVSQGALQGGADISGFCKGPASEITWVMGTDKALYHLTAAIQDEAIAEISTGEKTSLKSAPAACYVREGGAVYSRSVTGDWSYQVGEQGSLTHWKGSINVSPIGSAAQLGFDPNTGTPLLSKQGELHALEIEDGLSIRGLKQASFAASTSYPLGSVFNEGVILIGEKDAPRMVIISMQYAKNKLADAR